MIRLLGLVAKLGKKEWALLDNRVIVRMGATNEIFKKVMIEIGRTDRSNENGTLTNKDY